MDYEPKTKIEEIIKIINSINKTIEQIISDDGTFELEYLFPDKEWSTLKVKDKDI